MEGVGLSSRCLPPWELHIFIPVVGLLVLSTVLCRQARVTGGSFLHAPRPSTFFQCGLDTCRVMHDGSFHCVARSFCGVGFVSSGKKSTPVAWSARSTDPRVPNQIFGFMDITEHGLMRLRRVQVGPRNDLVVRVEGLLQDPVVYRFNHTRVPYTARLVSQCNVIFSRIQFSLTRGGLQPYPLPLACGVR